MSGLASASPPSATVCSSIKSKTLNSCLINPSSSVPVIPRTLTCSSDLKLKGLRFGGLKSPKRISVQCNSSTRPGPPGSGEGDSRTVLDAFFLGKAVAEALNERVESAVGEFLSTIGRLQSEQQKQVQEFQEDVFERAKKAKERAAREAMEARGLVPKSSTLNTSSDSDATSASPSNQATNSVTPVSPSSTSNPITPDVVTKPNPNNKGPVLGALNED
ncbi:chromatin modification-related protein EAF1 A-like [Melia azedarach]|uniref:Chromatin modification-related protein EAF1 A-like n=1 Tax=Melia azedarach TaxID=155640 RepID=A0ACC1YZN4_MELAZ|nr:chromatin modification-related protein EAF1 A-like [Melia azedarach]